MQQLNLKLANEEIKPKRKIILKKKENACSNLSKRFTIDLNQSQQSFSNRLKPQRLSLRHLGIRSPLSETNRFNINLMHTSSLDNDFKKCNTLTKIQHTNRSSVNSIQINNPNAKKIKAGLPYANLNLLEPNWWIKYEGESINLSKNGYGKLYLSNGEKFQGNFSNNMANGKGTFFRINGQAIIQGIWQNNILIQKL